MKIQKGDRVRHKPTGDKGNVIETFQDGALATVEFRSGQILKLEPVEHFYVYDPREGIEPGVDDLGDEEDC